MAVSETASALNEALTTCRAQFDRTIENAERVLENRRNEHWRVIAQSEARVADLESQLELFEALEQDRRAAQVRTELATAIAEHQSVVTAADRMLAGWLADHIKSYAAAGIAMEASFNAATSRLNANGRLSATDLAL